MKNKKLSILRPIKTKSYMSKLVMVAIILLTLVSCTDNERARYFGGTETIKIEPQEKFINVTWKDNDLWVIVEDTITGTIYAKEKSAFGIMQGKVIIQK
jgi:hypothetical protein